MIAIEKFNQLCLDILQAVPGFAGHKLVVHEGHAQKKLGTNPGIWLLAIMPSADRQGKQNAGVDRNVTWFFVLEKDKPGLTDPQEQEQYRKTQEMIVAVRQYLEDRSAEGYPLLTRYETSETNIDPEYNVFGGWNGWSMSVVF